MLSIVDQARTPNWSEDVRQADWIARRLSGNWGTVLGVIPDGFEAYSRVLHPVETPERGRDRLVRWRDVAERSGMPLRHNSQYHSIALPPERPATPGPDFGHGPRVGSLYSEDIRVLAEIGRRWTSTPELCWFCLWDGYGWNNMVFMVEHGASAPPVPPDPIPDSVREGPKVRLPNRSYFVYSGPVEAGVATFGLSDTEQSPNLWWPQDQSWCIATELDLEWTYVAGSAGMIDDILTDSRIEALPANPAEPINRIEDWVKDWIDTAIRELMETGQTSITTSMGTMEASIEMPSPPRQGSLSYRSTDLQGRTRQSGGQPLGIYNAEHMDRIVRSVLTKRIIAMAEF